MTAAEIAAIINLCAALEPEAATLATKLIAAFESSSETPEQRMQAITDLQSKLKPMQPV